MKLNLILLNEYKDEMNTTRRFLEAIPEDLYAFTPHEKSKTFGQLINHVLPISSWVPVVTENAELDWSKATPPEVLNSKEDILRQFEANIALSLIHI